jgi:hypothetical protein
LIKEEFSLFLVPLGVVIFFQYHDSKKAILTVLGGAAVFIFLVYFLNPMISPDLRNWAHYSLGYGAGGSSPQEVVINLFTHPQKMLALLFDNPVKLTTVVVQFSSFGFLPLLSPATLGPLGYEYFVRFINTAQPPKWLAHDFDFGVILAVSAVYGAAFWRRHFDSRLLAVFLLAAALAGDYFFHGPINSLLKSQLYRQEAWAKNNHQVLAFVPMGTAVAANNSLVPHLAMREKIYLLPETGGAEYIVVDLHGGPNAYAPIDYGGTVRLVEKLIGEKKYRREVKIGEAWLLKKL